MHFAQLIQARHSVRAYRPDPVPESLLTQVLEAARWAPTACNRQPFRIIVLRTEGRKAELGQIYPREWFVQAPIIIGIVGVPGEAWVRRDGVSYCQVDVAIAFDHLILAAAELGLGTCWVGAFDARAAREVLRLPPEVEPVAFTPLGYAADEPQPRQRRPLTDLLRRERW